MSIKENETQNTWFAAKLLIENGFTADADQWLKDPDDEVDPHDSISFDASRRSQRKSECSGKSKKRGQGTASASVKAEAGRAALIARAVLKEKNGLEAEEEQLGKKKGTVGDQSRNMCINCKASRLSSCLGMFKCPTNAFGMDSYLPS